MLTIQWNRSGPSKPRVFESFIVALNESGVGGHSLNGRMDENQPFVILGFTIYVDLVANKAPNQ